MREGAPGFNPNDRGQDVWAVRKKQNKELGRKEIAELKAQEAATESTEDSVEPAIFQALTAEEKELFSDEPLEGVAVYNRGETLDLSDVDLDLDVTEPTAEKPQETEPESEITEPVGLEMPEDYNEELIEVLHDLRPQEIKWQSMISIAQDKLPNLDLSGIDARDLEKYTDQAITDEAKKVMQVLIKSPIRKKLSDLLEQRDELEQRIERAFAENPIEGINEEIQELSEQMPAAEKAWQELVNIYSSTLPENEDLITLAPDKIDEAISRASTEKEKKALTLLSQSTARKNLLDLQKRQAETEAKLRQIEDSQNNPVTSTAPESNQAANN